MVHAWWRRIFVLISFMSVTQRPELSGLVLSLLDRTGRKQDGFLRCTTSIT